MWNSWSFTIAEVIGKWFMDFALDWKGDIKVPFIATLLRRVWHQELTGKFYACLHVYIPSSPGIWPTQSCTMVHALRNAYEHSHGCTVRVILHCWILSSIYVLGYCHGVRQIWNIVSGYDTCSSCINVTCHIWRESMDTWICECSYLVHEYSLYFCYEFCCLCIYPVYFHQ